MEAWKGLNSFDDEEMGSGAKEHVQSWKLDQNGPWFPMQSWILPFTKTRTCEGQVSKPHFKHTVWVTPQRVVPLLSKSNSPTEQKIQRKDPSCQQTQVSKGRGKTPAWSRSSFSWLMTSLVRWEPFPFTNLSTRGHMSEVPLATLFLTKNLGLKVTTFFQRPCRDDLFPS